MKQEWPAERRDMESDYRKEILHPKHRRILFPVLHKDALIDGQLRLL